MKIVAGSLVFTGVPRWVPGRSSAGAAAAPCAGRRGRGGGQVLAPRAHRADRRSPRDRHDLHSYPERAPSALSSGPRTCPLMSSRAGGRADRITAAFSEGLRTCSTEVRAAVSPARLCLPLDAQRRQPPLLLPFPQVQKYGLCLKATLPEVRGALPSGGGCGQRQWLPLSCWHRAASFASLILSLCRSRRACVSGSSSSCEPAGPAPSAPRSPAPSEAAAAAQQLGAAEPFV